MSHERSELAGLHKLKQQVTEEKEDPLELRSKKGKENMPGGRTGGKALGALERGRCPGESSGWGKVQVCSKERKRACSVPCLTGF